MKSQVFFSDVRVNSQRNLFDKLDDLLDRVDLKGKVKERDLVAIKMHFGEKGNTAFIRPIFVRRIVERIRELKGKPFLTDANTLYRGERGNGISHLTVAMEHGFSYATVAAPVVIADGVRGKSSAKVQVDTETYKEVDIGAEVVAADGIVCLSHFKGHELTGFGGALKNLGMGCASRSGKLSQHCTLSPKVNRKDCTACQTCIDWCAQGAISLADGKARINDSQCIGCAECIMICPQEAIQIRWDVEPAQFQKRMVDHAYGVWKLKREKMIFITFLTQVSPACDCYNCSDMPIVPDIGILASLDPVAIDRASADLVNHQEGNKASQLSSHFGAGEDKFRGLYPKVDWGIQLEYAESLGMGSRRYKLVTL